MSTLVGQSLGGYRLIQQIGKGGMAVVFKAYQPAMDRYVALKIISGSLVEDEAFVQRFQQEARVIAKLEHAHILPVYDHGQAGDSFYLTMRLVETGTLSDRLKAGPVSLQETRRLVSQIGSALAHAHRLGIIHRDFKPSNVLVDAQGNYYLTDFGIAKMVENTLGLTGGGIIGTPHYMAPEQGRSPQVDHRADIYAMGVVIYEMVTGRVPYQADTPFAVVLKHISEPLPSPRLYKPDLPEAIEQVILKALAKSPADRYQSMGELMTAFEQVVDRLPPETLTAPTQPAFSPPSPTEPQQAASTAIESKHRLPWLLLILALVVMLGAALVIGIFFFQRWRQTVASHKPTPVAENRLATQIAATLYAEQTVSAPATQPAPTATPTSTSTPTPTPTPSPTSPPLPDALVKAVVTDLWAGPGSNYNVIDQVKKGDDLRVTGRDEAGDWLQVVTPNGAQGWVAVMWLQINTRLDKVPVVVVPPPATLTPTPTNSPTATPVPEKPAATSTLAIGLGYVQPGQTVSDPVGDIIDPIADVVAFNSNLSGEMLQLTVHQKDLSAPLSTAPAEAGSPNIFVLTIGIDVDNQPVSGKNAQAVDYNFYLSFQPNPEGGNPSIEQLTNPEFQEGWVSFEQIGGDQSLFCYLDNQSSPHNTDPADCTINFRVDTQANTLTFVGLVPHITAESRLFLTSFTLTGQDDLKNSSSVSQTQPAPPPTQAALPSPTPTPVDLTRQAIIQEILQAPLLGQDKFGVIMVNCQGKGALDWYIEEPRSEYRLITQIPAYDEGHCGLSHLEGFYTGFDYEFGYLAPWLGGLQTYRMARLPAGQVGVMYFGEAMDVWGSHADLKASLASSP